jgi:hypothetical protein
MEILARFHWPESRWRLYPPRRTVVRGAEAARLAEDLPFDADRAVYVIGREWLSDPDAALRDALGRRYQPCPGTSVRGIRILCLSRGDGNHERTANRTGQSPVPRDERRAPGKPS